MTPNKSKPVAGKPKRAKRLTEKQRVALNKFSFQRFASGWFYCRKGIEFDSLAWSLTPHKTKAKAQVAILQRLGLGEGEKTK